MRLPPDEKIAAALRANDDARQTAPEVHLHVFDEGDDRATLEALIAALDLGHRVTLNGHVSGAAAQFSGAGSSVTASRFEGFPLFLVERMARG